MIYWIKTAVIVRCIVRFILHVTWVILHTSGLWWSNFKSCVSPNNLFNFCYIFDCIVHYLNVSVSRKKGRVLLLQWKIFRTLKINFPISTFPVECSCRPNYACYVFTFLTVYLHCALISTCICNQLTSERKRVGKTFPICSCLLPIFFPHSISIYKKLSLAFTVRPGVLPANVKKLLAFATITMFA